MSTHEILVQYLKIAIALALFIVFVLWGVRMTTLLDTLVQLQALTNDILLLNITNTPQ